MGRNGKLPGIILKNCGDQPNLSNRLLRSIAPQDREFDKTQNLILESEALPHFPKLKIRF
jgi:hypothetical protein